MKKENTLDYSINHKVKLLDHNTINAIFAVIACLQYAMDLNGHEVIEDEKGRQSVHFDKITVDKENLEDAFAALKKLSSSLNIVEVKAQKGKLISSEPAKLVHKPSLSFQAWGG